MINNNKILTVSYGTFSCTLEGFDDSFGTMKAIAEYFRDLAADDRYFGAEPPQPDAQMLARIAQREISRHVEARQDEGRIVLSAKSTPQDAELVASDVVEDVATAVADAAATKATLASEEVKATPEAETAPADAATPEEKPAQMAETVAEAPATKAAPAEEPAAAVAETREEADAHAPEAEEERDIVPSLPDSEVEAFFADRPARATEDYAESDDVDDAVIAPNADAAKASSIADKLKRIRAVVSQQADTEATPAYSEDQHADAAVGKAEVATTPVVENIPAIDEPITDFSDEDAFDGDEEDDNDVLSSTLRDLEDALDADDEYERAEEAIDADTADGEESEDDDITAILNRLESEASTTAHETPEAAQEDDSDDNILAGIDVSDAFDDSDDDNLFDDEDAVEDELAADEEDDVAEPVAETPPPAPAAPRTRVLKVKRATLEAAIQSGKLEEYDDEDEEQPETSQLRKAPLADRSTLSDEAEEDLARELAELEADMSAEDEAAANDDLADEEDYDEDAEAEAPAEKPEMRSAADADFSRLMEESDHQMDEPEAATRRDAFAHLRAAVASKKADEAVGGGEEESETDEAYRDDLANVVRPRRPVSGDRARTERPAEKRPAPLKLVAEQRIDVDQQRSATPVRPRRVAAVATPAPIESDAASFADFASEMGAEKLPDLLEAAAAYLSFVEGHEQFSRPQLMTKVRQVEQENFTREDSLRSFGKLLREGKIEKLKGGRFQASEQIGFKPDARAVG